MRSPSVSCLDVDTSPSTNESTPATLTPSTPTKSHRRSASCGNNPAGTVQGSGPDMRIIRIRMDLQDGNLYRSILVPTHNRSLSSELFWSPNDDGLPQDGSALPTQCGAQTSLEEIKLRHRRYFSPSLPLLCAGPQVTSNDKTPAVISSALEKHNQDPKQASRHELIQLLPEGKGNRKRRRG